MTVLNIYASSGCTFWQKKFTCVCVPYEAGCHFKWFGCHCWNICNKFVSTFFISEKIFINFINHKRKNVVLIHPAFNLHHYGSFLFILLISYNIVIDKFLLFYSHKFHCYIHKLAFSWSCGSTYKVERRNLKCATFQFFSYWLNKRWCESI